MKRALILGASGLVGGHCLRLLLEHPGYSTVATIGRRKLEAPDSPKLEQRVVDFERIEDYAEAFRGDDLFYCLGTVLSKAGSKEAFRRIDQGYALRAARLAKAEGVKRWLMVTSAGARADSPFFYLRIKGEIERDVAALGFTAVHFFQPSFLLGERSERRALEGLSIPILKAVSPLMLGPLRRYRPVEAAEVARQMIEAAQSSAMGVLRRSCRPA